MADNSKFVPPKGMRDWLPQETLLRQKLIRLIESHYQLYGFQPIDTPVMENIEVLQGKGGGENEKLMFKVQKRGDEFLESLSGEIKSSTYLLDLINKQKQLQIKEAESHSNPVSIFDVMLTEPQPAGSAFLQNLVLEEARRVSDGISDIGLRFDMTVPLARYYGNHANDLPKPFRCYHIGPVWRADRPQKGRFREFYQCDIDVIGSTSGNCEVELLLATDRVLKALGIGKFKIRISDKRLLTEIFKIIGIQKETADKVAIAIDKLDKQSMQEVLNEISRLGIGEEQLGHIKTLIDGIKGKGREAIQEVLKSIGPNGADYKFLNEILEGILKTEKDVKAINSNANVYMDTLLVRGFDYYTGPVFEINVEDKDFTFSIGGGGRYDGLIEKLGGPKNTPAVGLSLGFERILTILMERGGVSKSLKSRVYIVNDKHSEKDIQVLAETLRSHGIAVETGLEKKDKVKQLVAAQGSGLEYAITDFVPGAQTFKVRQLSNRQDTEMNAEQLKEVLSKLL